MRRAVDQLRFHLQAILVPMRPTLLAFPELRRLRCLRAPNIERTGLALLIASEHLTGLRWLDLNRGRIGAV